MSASAKVQSRNEVRRRSAPRSTARRKLTRLKMEARKSARDKSVLLKSTSMKSFQLAVDSERSEPRNDTLRISDREKNVRGSVRSSRTTSASRVRKKLTPCCSSSWRGGPFGSGGNSSGPRTSRFWRIRQDSVYDARSAIRAGNGFTPIFTDRRAKRSHRTAERSPFPGRYMRINSFSCKNPIRLGTFLPLPAVLATLQR